jgi:hypothetical protein
MKVHAGVDAGTGYVHTLTGISANMHDVTETSKLIRLLVPLIVLLVISLSTMGEQKEITSDIKKIINEPTSKIMNAANDVTTQLEKLADLKTKGIITETGVNIFRLKYNTVKMITKKPMRMLLILYESSLHRRMVCLAQKLSKL